MAQSNTQKALNGMSSQTIVTLTLGIVEIISFSIMSHLLTQEDFGYYAAITAITTIFASFSETGIGSAIIQRKEINDRFINNAYSLSFIFGTVLTVLLLVLAKPLAIIVADQRLTVPLMLMSITLLCNCISSVNTSIMYRRLEFLQVGIINLISLVVTTIVAIALAINGYGYISILAKAVLTSVLTVIASWIMAKTKFSFALDQNTFKDIFGFSGWLMASVFFRNFAQQVDKLLMTRLLSVNALGAYNRPKEFIAQITGKLGNIFDTALFPVLSQIQDNYDSLKNAYLKSMYLLNLASIVLALGFVFNGELIIRIFFGSDWLDTLLVFQVLSISIVFHFGARLADCYLRSMALTKSQFFFRILEVSLKITGLIVAYRWGIIGVAISVLVTDILAIFIKHIYISRKLQIGIVETTLTVINSWKIVITIVPFMLLVEYVVPCCLWGEIISLLAFTTYIASSFLLFPSLIGKRYRDNTHVVIIKKIKKFLVNRYENK